MSRQRYLSSLCCGNPQVIAHQVWLLHPEFISDATGVNYYEQPMTASVLFHQRFDVDNGGPVHTDNTPLPRPEAETGDGGQRSGEGFNTVWRTEKPFTEPEELWNFNPDPWGKDANKAVQPEHAMRNFRWCFEPETWDNRRKQEKADWENVERLFPGKFTDARGFYCTTFMWGICLFGWDVFLVALGLDPDKTGQTLQRISEVTRKMYEYFATCDGAFFVVPHDDVCIATGPAVSPQWYRKYIWPQYEKIFAPLRTARKHVIYISDGDIRKLAPDIAPLVDGFIFESSTPADFMFEQFGRDKCLIGGIDVRPLTLGSPEDVRQEVSKAIDKGRDCPGYVIACSDTIPANVPLENVYAYFDAVEKHRRR